MALSFTVAEVSRKGSKDLETYYARLSNGPMESFNRKPKDYKRNARGTSNFDYTRNRILWAERKNPPILGIPKTSEQIHTKSLSEKTKKKRGSSYNKKK
nr:transposase [Dubosiella newyorkensis]